MFANLKALFIDTGKADSDALSQALAPDIYFIDSGFCGSLSEGLNRVLEQSVNVCFIAESFPPEEIQSFLRDIQRVPEMRRCVVTLVKNSNDGSLKRNARVSEGIHSIITRQVTADDKQALSSALEAVVTKGRIIDEKVHDVAAKIDNLIQQVDDVAMDRKRGIDAKFNSIVPRFVKDAANFDSEVLDSYLDNLSETLEEVDTPPPGFESIEVPDRLLNGKFPKLRKDSYYGSSRRLWKKLSARWARKNTPEGQES